METTQEQTIDPAMEGLEPKKVWEFFDAITQIPRNSGKEDQMIDSLINWALTHDFELVKDTAGNLCIKVPATPGHENVAPVCLQCHADMVCVKEPDSTHNFETDPIQLKRGQREGRDVLQADKTTLGADNGIGIATAMAIAEDAEAVHPPLEILITVHEEDGCEGAKKLDASFLGMKSTRILNLDSEDTGETTVSSAGLQKVIGSEALFRRDSVDDFKEGDKYYEISISGMPGGHSGADIHKNRGNAILLLGEFLDKLRGHMHLVSFDGGQAHNAIPKDARAIVMIPTGPFMQGVVMDMALLNEKLQQQWPTAKMTMVEKAEEEIRVGLILIGIHAEVLKALKDVPNGMIEMNPAVPGLTQTSSNLGKIETGKDKIELTFSVRSSINAKMGEVVEQIVQVLKRNNFDVEKGDPMPGWDGDPECELVKRVNAAYEAVAGASSKTVGIHAGLETGYLVTKLGEKLGGKVDAVSIGPTIKNPHSPDEYIDIGSVEIFYRQLKEALRLLATEEV
ncbi:beta-Ala-His dipeptidase [Candidatus Peregrinibacteria bacterium]|nr:beta-Ala-His dipeptidase [Candidatus Peregrinibacteria bacterium]